MRPENALSSPGFIKRMNPARAMTWVSHFFNVSMYRCSASPSSLVLKGDASMKCAGKSRCLARSRIWACSTSESTQHTAALRLPSSIASQIAWQLDPLPDPSTAIRSGCRLLTVNCGRWLRVFGCLLLVSLSSCGRKPLDTRIVPMQVIRVY